MPTTTIKDGVPHIVYFDVRTQLSFEWTGHIHKPIEVAHGGYGEPRIDTIPARGFTPVPLFRQLKRFKRICRAYADNWDGDTTPIDQRPTHLRVAQPGDGCRILGDGKVQHFGCDKHPDGVITDVRTNEVVKS